MNLQAPRFRTYLNACHKTLKNYTTYPWLVEVLRELEEALKQEAIPASRRVENGEVVKYVPFIRQQVCGVEATGVEGYICVFSLKDWESGAVVLLVNILAEMF